MRSLQAAGRPIDASLVSTTTPVRTASATMREIFSIAEKTGVSQNSLARRLNKGVNQVFYWRRGIKTPSILTVEEIADALGYRLALIEKEG